MLLLAAIFILFVIILCLAKHFLWIGELKRVRSQHVFITGGSSGIGRSVALEIARRGAHITIIARNVAKLQETKIDIIKACSNPESQKVQYISVDITDSTAVEAAINKAEQDFGPIYMLINCAGQAICGKIENMSMADVNYMVNLNLMGTIYTVKSVVSRMKARKEGIVVLTASQGALLGIFGMAAYASAKFALRGFAESLYQEVFKDGITVTLALPPDTDTPGFAVEEINKPIETKLISQSGGLYSPDDVGKQLVLDALRGRFFSYIGFESFILTTLCAGMSPITSYTELFLQVLLMGPLRLVGAIFLFSFQRIIGNCAKNGNLK